MQCKSHQLFLEEVHKNVLHMQKLVIYDFHRGKLKSQGFGKHVHTFLIQFKTLSHFSPFYCVEKCFHMHFPMAITMMFSQAYKQCNISVLPTLNTIQITRNCSGYQLVYYQLQGQVRFKIRGTSVSVYQLHTIYCEIFMCFPPLC